MIEIDIGNLQKGEQRVNVKGHKSGNKYIKPHIRVIKTAAEADAEMNAKMITLENYKDAAVRTKDWVRDNPDRHVDVGNTSDYTVGNYDVVNEALREGFTDKELAFTTLGGKIESISAFIKDAPKFEGITYRGMSFFMVEGFDAPQYDKFMDDINKSESISLPAFTSTSINKDVAEKFMPKHKKRENILLEIKSKRGVALDGVAEFPREQEVLFDKNTEFKIIGIEEIDKVKHIKLEEI